MIKLSDYKDQSYNQDKNLGFMRFDFVNGSLANSFVPSSQLKDCSDKAQLQSELNEILFEQLGTWEKVGNFVDEMKCLHEFDANDIAFLFAETEKFQYLVRLMPSDINKIHVFEK